MKYIHHVSLGVYIDTQKKLCYIHIHHVQNIDEIHAQYTGLYMYTLHTYLHQITIEDIHTQTIYNLTTLRSRTHLILH